MAYAGTISFADGTVLDTGDADSRNAFKQSHPEIIKGIEDIRDRVLADEELVKRIKHKYAIKNVTGLNIYPFVEHTDPFDIITHLMVGSEGTLGFASEFTMTTGHLYPYSSSAMLYFKDMREACECVVALKNSPVECAELLDKKSLASVNDTTGENLTAILVRTSADTKEQPMWQRWKRCLKASISMCSPSLPPTLKKTPNIGQSALACSLWWLAPVRWALL